MALLGCSTPIQASDSLQQVLAVSFLLLPAAHSKVFGERKHLLGRRSNSGNSAHGPWGTSFTWLGFPLQNLHSLRMITKPY